MKFPVQPSHVAILVPSVKKAAQNLTRYGFSIGPEQVWDNEGTCEIYVQKESNNSLLLMEPIKPGPYQNALTKRGPGLHHLAIDVLNLEQFLNSIVASGWLLHLSSIESIKSSRTAYLARPGFPGLIEVQEKKELTTGPLFVEQVLIPLKAEQNPLLQAIGLEKIVQNSLGESQLLLRGQKVDLETLF